MRRSPPLALFDLDHTLLAGDSDVLWCRFLVRHGLLEATQLERNQAMEQRYRSGSVSVAEFCDFYVAMLAGHGPAFWEPWRERFVHEAIAPRLPPGAHALVDRHRAQGHTLVLTTATNRVITEKTAAMLSIAHLIATEVEIVQGLYSGRTQGVPNMRQGKVERMHAWLAAQNLPCSELDQAWFYSDSANDLPLLCAVGHPVAVNPDERLLEYAHAHAWPVLHLHRNG